MTGIEVAIDRVALDERYSPGTRVGPYRILNEIGHGGMGVVYRAERADDVYRKEVAVKIVRRGLNARAIGERFRRERQTLAGLDHPNITRIVDGGTTDDGCRGGRRFRPPEPGRAQRSQARQHSRFGRWRAQLVDFGIARLPDQTELAPEGAPFAGLMTPEYASPEQIQGKPITTATDIYSLGVVLYVLLSGRRPYDIASRDARQVEHVICETSPRPPSAVAKTQALSRRLAGDLDAIVQRAMQKQPGLRYASVEQLSEDIGPSQ